MPARLFWYKHLLCGRVNPLAMKIKTGKGTVTLAVLLGDMVGVGNRLAAGAGDLADPRRPE